MMFQIEAYQPLPNWSRCNQSRLMTRYRRWTKTDIRNLEKSTGLREVWTEVDEDGSVQREIGFSSTNEVAHGWDHSRRPGGIFEMAVVEPRWGANDAIRRADFEARWEEAEVMLEA